MESTGRNGEGSCFSFTLASGSVSDAKDQVKGDGGSIDRAKEEVKSITADSAYDLLFHYKE